MTPPIPIPHTLTRFARSCTRLLAPHPLARQYDRADCGPACLLSVLRSHGGDAAMTHVRELSGTDANGTTLLGLRQAAHALGFDARGAQGDYDALRREALPCVAHVIVDGKPHYVVVYEAHEKRVRVGDPASGVRWMARQDFEQIWSNRVVLLLIPGRELSSEPTPHWVLWFITRLRHTNGWLIQSVFLGLVYTLLGLVTAVVVQRLIDDMIPAQDAKRILAAGAFLTALQLVRSLVGYLRQRFLVGLSKRAASAMAEEFLERLFKLPARFFDTRKLGDITTRLQDASHIQASVLHVLGSTTIDILVTLLSLAIVFRYSSLLGWTALILLPPFIVLTGLVARKLRHEQHEALSAYGRLQASYVDAIDGIETIRSHGAGGLFTRLHCGLFGVFQNGVERLGITHATVASKLDGFGGALLAVVLTVGALEVLRGDLGLGAMIASYSLVVGVLPSLKRVTDSVFNLQAGAAAAQRLQDLLLSDPEEDAGSLPFRMATALRLEEAHFSWPHGGPLLRGAGLTLPRGRIIGLTGPNGSGKSTLVRILTRSYPIGAGRLMIDDIPAEDIDLRQYRQNVGVIPEAVKIFNGTLGDNLLLSEPGLSPEVVALRLRALSTDAFMSRFPAGLSTVLGEDGRRVSAGERQIIGLIRTLMATPSVIIVDEGLNALDPPMFELARNLLQAHARRGAVLLISHDPAVLRLADQVFVLDRGVITAEIPARAA